MSYFYDNNIASREMCKHNIDISLFIILTEKNKWSYSPKCQTNSLRHSDKSLRIKQNYSIAPHSCQFADVWNHQPYLNMIMVGVSHLRYAYRAVLEGSSWGNEKCCFITLNWQNLHDYISGTASVPEASISTGTSKIYWYQQGSREILAMTNHKRV